MHVIYQDGRGGEFTEPLHLIHLNAGWHVVTRGYICRVENEAEGKSLMTALQPLTGSLPPD